MTEITIYFLATCAVEKQLTKNERDSLRRRAKQFFVEDGLLYRKGTKKNQNLLVIRDSQKQQILEGCHSNKLGGGHFGRDKTLSKVSERYHWKGIVEDVKTFCRTCDKCQRANRCTTMLLFLLLFDSFVLFSPKQEFTAELHPIPLKDQVWHTIGVDLIGPLPVTARGNKYIMTVSCLFSKWPEAIALQLLPSSYISVLPVMDAAMLRLVIKGVNL